MLLAPSRPAPSSQNRVKLHGNKASLLTPNRGEPIKTNAVIIHEDKTDRVGPQSKTPAKYSTIPFAHVSYLMPGLWECHVPYFGPSESDEGGYAGLHSSAVQAGARIPKDLEQILLASFTSVREVGGVATGARSRLSLTRGDHSRTEHLLFHCL